MHYTKVKFSNAEEVHVVEEAQPSETNRCLRVAVEPKQATIKELKPIACVHKILKSWCIKETNVISYLYMLSYKFYVYVHVRPVFNSSIGSKISARTTIEIGL